jgi:hypothetical protein
MLFLSNISVVESSNSSWLTYVTPIASALIAGSSLYLARVSFLYTQRKDNKTEANNAQAVERNIKLQWFKELIVQPNISVINDFYDNIHTIKDKINSNDLSQEEKIELNDFVKAELVKLRKSFIDVLLLVDKKFGEQILANMDELTDAITNAIFDDELKLKNITVYEKNIGSKISYSKNSLIAQLYNYKGL